MRESKTYKHLFFDLDRTLWDFDASARVTFREMIAEFRLSRFGIDNFDVFYEVYTGINEHLWDLYKQNRIEKSVLRSKRFRDLLHHFGTDDPALAEKMGDFYVRESPRRANLFPGTHEVLSELHKRYSLHIITNGFEEVQAVKMESGDLNKYFQTVITSEAAGVKKPDPGIFSFALQQAGANSDDSLMIGDDFAVDIVGAKNAGIDQVLVYSTPENGCAATWCCKNLRQLLEIL